MLKNWNVRNKCIFFCKLSIVTVLFVILSKYSWNILYVHERDRVLWLTISTLKAFAPRFTADKGESMNQFLFLHHFGGSLCRVMRVSMERCQREEYVCYNVWVMNLWRGRVTVIPVPALAYSYRKTPKWQSGFNIST